MNGDVTWVLENRQDLEVKRRREKELREEIKANFHIILCVNYQNYGWGRMFSKNFSKAEKGGVFGSQLWLGLKGAQKINTQLMFEKTQLLSASKANSSSILKNPQLDFFSLNHPHLTCCDLAYIYRPWYETGIRSGARRCRVFGEDGDSCNKARVRGRGVMLQTRATGAAAGRAK